MSSPKWEWYPTEKEFVDFRHLQSVPLQMTTQPTILIAEATFISLALLTLLHASLTSRKFVTVWFAAIISGTINDIIFMVLPFVDNFWHAQVSPRALREEGGEGGLRWKRFEHAGRSTVINTMRFTTQTRRSYLWFFPSPSFPL